MKVGVTAGASGCANGRGMARGNEDGKDAGKEVRKGRGLMARRRWRRLRVAIGREVADFRQNEGLTWLVLFGLWLLVLWGVIALAGRAGMY